MVVNLKNAKKFWKQLGIKVSDDNYSFQNKDINPLINNKDVVFDKDFKTQNPFSVNLFVLFENCLTLVKEQNRYFNLVGGSLKKSEKVKEAAIRESCEEILIEFKPKYLKEVGTVTLEQDRVYNVPLLLVRAEKGKFVSQLQEVRDEEVTQIKVVKLENYFKLFENKKLAKSILRQVKALMIEE